MTVLVGISAFGLTACGLTAEEAQELYDDFIFENQSCEQASDCAYVNATPSQQCRVDTVNTDSVRDTLEYAEELRGDLSDDEGDINLIGCLEPEADPICDDGRCAFPEDSTPAEE